MNKTTGIGSLPFTDIDLALKFSLEHDLAFVPELTKLNEQMFTRNKEILVKASELLSNKKLKNQIMGPATFEKLTGKGIIEYQDYFLKTLSEHRELKSAYQLDLYLQIDEPVLLTSNNYRLQYLQLLEKMEKNDINPIFHTCQKITCDYTFPDWNKPYLAIDVQLNPNYINHPLLLIEGYDPRITNKKSNAEYSSFTCGYGLLTEKEIYEIKKLF